MNNTDFKLDSFNLFLDIEDVNLDKNMTRMQITILLRQWNYGRFAQ